MLLAQRLDGEHLRGPDRGQLEDQQVGHLQPARLEGHPRQAILQRHGLEIPDDGGEPVDLGQPLGVFGCDQDLQHGVLARFGSDVVAFVLADQLQTEPPVDVCMLSRVMVVVNGGMGIVSRASGITVETETLAMLTVAVWHVARAVAGSASHPVGA